MKTIVATRLLSVFGLLIVLTGTHLQAQLPAPNPNQRATARQKKTPPKDPGPISPSERNKILQDKHVKHDPSAAVLRYGVEHPFDKSGNLDLANAADINFGDSKFAMFEPPSGGSVGEVSLTFLPLAANKLHLVMFTITSESAGTASIALGTASPQNFPVQVGTNHFAVIVQASAAGTPCYVTLYGPQALWVFWRATVELVK